MINNSSRRDLCVVSVSDGGSSGGSPSLRQIADEVKNTKSEIDSNNAEKQKIVKLEYFKGKINEIKKNLECAEDEFNGSFTYADQSFVYNEINESLELCNNIIQKCNKYL